MRILDLALSVEGDVMWESTGFHIFVVNLFVLECLSRLHAMLCKTCRVRETLWSAVSNVLS